MSRHVLTIRPATSADKGPILAFCAQTWDDGDYIAEVWDEWFHDPSSTLLVGTLHQQPVAVAHVSVVTAEGWFEGLRVAPHQRGQGFGRQMLQASLAEARRLGARVLRMITLSTNAPMQALLSQLGFERCFDATWFSLPYKPGPAPQPLMKPLAELEADLASAQLLQETGGLYADGWSFRSLTRTRLADHLALGQVVQVPNVAGWAIVMPDGEGDHAAIALAVGDVAGLLAGLRSHPLAQASNEIRVFLPIAGELAAIAVAAGYRPRPYQFGLYAHLLSKLQ